MNLDLTAVCAAADCDSPRYCKGLCTLHYQRLRNHGSLDRPVRAHQGITDGLTRYVIADDGCWQWTGPINGHGYGVLWLGHERYVMAHRASFEHHKAPVPDGLQLDHLCRNRACINPDHLEPVTVRENVLRGEGTSAVNARKAQCVRGHPFDEANTYSARGRRYCRECRREAQRSLAREAVR